LVFYCIADIRSATLITFCFACCLFVGVFNFFQLCCFKSFNVWRFELFLAERRCNSRLIDE